MISRDSIMAEWDRWREYIAGGGTGSWPRDAFEALLDRHDEELERHKKWVNDLQSGMYINCVYCGHRYGPKKNTPVAMADVLKEHIEKCPKHPLSKTKEELEWLRDVIKNYLKAYDAYFKGITLIDTPLHNRRFLLEDFCKNETALRKEVKDGI